jgi:hypothetical protein
MQKADSVITQAAKGIVEELADEYGVGISRMYQILEQDTYNRTAKLKRRIARVDKERARLIKAADDALWAEIFGDECPKEIDCAALNDELTDVIKARLHNLPRADRLRECWEARIALDAEIASLTEREEININVFGDLNITNSEKVN